MIENNPHDPELKEAMSKIKAILEEHGIAGAISLGSRTHAEFLVHFPAWSIVTLHDRGFHVRSHHSNYESKEAEATVHVLLRFRDIAKRTVNAMDCLENTLRLHGWEICHNEDEGFTPHRPH